MGSWDLVGVYRHVSKFTPPCGTNLNFWPLGIWIFDRWKFEFSNFVHHWKKNFFLFSFRIYRGLYMYLLPILSYRLLKRIISGCHLSRPGELALAIVGPRLREFNHGPAEKSHLRGLGPWIVAAKDVFRKLFDVFVNLNMWGGNIVGPFGRA